MGMDPFNFADALLGVLAQRLAKRLCSQCKLAYEPSADELQQLLTEYCVELINTETFQKDRQAGEQAVLDGWKRNYSDGNGRFKLYKAVGCDQCSGGYKGRVGLHELMIGTDRLKRLIQEHSRVATMLAAALEDGMLTLKMDGIEKILSGITDIKQVRAVCIK
jgi:type II secretory ATPase GspE/PulE/Tfp pilus assembly ATPase PilB-like protein